MKRRILGLAAAVALCSAVSVVSPASADPLVITGGFYNGLTGQFTLDGAGFSLSARDDFPVNPCEPCSTTRVTPIDFNVSLNESPFSPAGSGTFNNVSYPVTALNGNLSFTAPAVLSSALSAPTTTITVPFSMTGNLIGFSSVSDENAYFNNGVTTNAFVNDTFTGSGTVIATFDSAGQGLFDSKSVMYELGASSPSPTPEPASMLLLGTGLLGGAVRRFRNFA